MSFDGRRATPGRLGDGRALRLVITDSGLGGLSVCAGLEKALRSRGDQRNISLIYVNAWPDEMFGYNDLPGLGARARVFDKALAAMAHFRPDLILIACNTLSVLYDLTDFSRRGGIPALGIIEAGVDLFAEALGADEGGSLAIFGTRTTIESGVYKKRLVERGIASERLSAVACHGLAAAIETDPGGREVDRLLTTFAADACRTAPRSGAGTWYAGLACTHYGYVQDKFRAELEKCSGRPVRILDPNERLVSLVATELGEAARVVGERRSSGAVSGSELTGAGNTVEVISKVSLDEKKRRAVAARIKPVSGLTARALLHYKHQPDLF